MNQKQRHAEQVAARRAPAAPAPEVDEPSEDEG
jgi:hypothetical protein